MEITLPAPEGTSNSLLIVMGQVTGIVAIFGMDAAWAPDGSMAALLLVLAGLIVASMVMALFLRESPIHKRAAAAGK